jgi:hypothetical protein
MTKAGAQLSLSIPVSLAGIAFARLGETEEQLIARLVSLSIGPRR